MGIVSFGELLIDFVALETGVSVGEASGFEKKPGGAPANVAVAAAKLGQSSAFLGQVGDDPFGHYLAEVLRAEKVDVRGLRFSDAARTALAFVSLRADGERSFSFYRNPSADMVMRPEDVADDVIDGQDIFHFGSLTLQVEPGREATLAAVRYARDHGLLISYDPNLRLSLWKDADAARAGLMIGLPYANIVKVSDEELEFLTGGSDPLRLWHDQLKLIVVTHGAGGATAYTRDQVVHTPGFKVNAVDTTGAGDSFVAGLLVGLLEHGLNADTLPGILRFANACGAITTTARGAIPALPTRSAVEAFLRQS
ncbi:MAG TPA: PfkB family carbohydrate kinase [Phototrophicaceae bacterium]|nr:PfkB family carbohydrate kinase [Phototrophicaceae bacterium]